MKKTAKMLMVLLIASLSVSTTYAQVSIGISIRTAPPALPTYTQPPCPVDGYLWTPGYWAYNEDGGYYWVPGVWVAPPRPGYLWTPGYWGYDGALYVYHEGYWGRHIGFYGGVNYGYGYGGSGYVGGRWSGNSFHYNTAVVNVNKTVVHNTYINKTVVNNVTVNNHTSFNGPGGVSAQPRPEERAAEKEQHVQPTNDQVSHRQVAGKDRSQFASVNNGKPATAAMNKVNGKHFTPEGHSRASAANKAGDNANGNHPDNNGEVKNKNDRTDNSGQPSIANNAGEKPHHHANPGNADANKPATENRPQPVQTHHHEPNGHEGHQQHTAQHKPHQEAKPGEHEEHEKHR